MHEQMDRPAGISEVDSLLPRVLLTYRSYGATSTSLAPCRLASNMRAWRCCPRSGLCIASVLLLVCVPFVCAHSHLFLLCICVECASVSLACLCGVCDLLGVLTSCPLAAQEQEGHDRRFGQTASVRRLDVVCDDDDADGQE